jgi:hypothetical protein
LWDRTATAFGDWNASLASGRLRFNSEFAVIERKPENEKWDPVVDGPKKGKDQLWRQYGKRNPTFTHYAIWASMLSGASAIPVKWNDGKEFGEMRWRTDGTDNFGKATYPVDNFAEVIALREFLLGPDNPLDFSTLAPAPADLTADNAALKGHILRSENKSVCAGWLYNSQGSGNLAGVKVTIKGLKATTTYTVIWYNTWTGKKIMQATGGPSNADGQLEFDLYDLTASRDGKADQWKDNDDADIMFDRNDIAFKLVEGQQQ